MSENIINFSDYVKNKRGVPGDFADSMFDAAHACGMSIGEIIAACMILVDALCVVRPEHIEGVQQVANTLIGKQR